MLGPGGTWRIPPDTPHEVHVGTDGAVVLDVFSPPRADWPSSSARTSTLLAALDDRSNAADGDVPPRPRSRTAFARDPWSETHLQVAAIDPWTIRLDGRPRSTR